MTATIRVNGHERTLAVPSLAALLEEAGIDPAKRGTAVAVNGAVVPRDAWQATALKAGDAIEIVQPFRGG